MLIRPLLVSLLEATTMDKDLAHDLAHHQELESLRTEIHRLQKIVDVLIERAEQSITTPNSAFDVFQATVLLEDQVHSRTAELESALRKNEIISRELQCTQEKIAENARILKNILEYAPIGMSIIDATQRYILVNQAFCQIVGYEKAELMHMSPMDITHPDDKPISLHHLNGLWRNYYDAYQLEKRYLHKSGRPVWVKLSVSTIFDAQGIPVTYIGQVEDITTKRHAEENLRLAAKVFNCSNEAMMVTDQQNKIVTVNNAFSKLTGYTIADVIGQSPSMLGSGKHDRSFYENFWQQLNINGCWEGDIWNRKKSGEIFVERLSISTVLDNAGKIQNYVALFSDITAEHQAAEVIWEHANYDALTKLPNRHLFFDRLEQAKLHADRTSKAMALMFIDLDDFKAVNDSLGHQYGDDLLIQASARISQKVRESDSVARMGGDEFTIIFPAMTQTTHMTEIATQINQALASLFVLGKHEVYISASIGIAFYPQDALDTHHLIDCADKAMYCSKQQGRNTFNFYTPPMTVESINSKLNSRKHLKMQD